MPRYSQPSALCQAITASPDIAKISPAAMSVRDEIFSNNPERNSRPLTISIARLHSANIIAT